MIAVIRAALPILFLLSPLIPLAFYFQYNWYSFFHLYSLSVAAGVMSYVYFLNQFITGGRLKFLDRLYGYNRVLLYHRRMAMLGFMLVIFHAVTKDTPKDLQVELGKIALAIFCVVIVSALLFMSDALARVSLVSRLRDWLQRRLRLQYQHFLLIHNGTVIAMSLALAHVLLALSTQESPYRLAIMTLWYVVAVGTYFWHKLLRPRALKRHPFRVSQIIRHTPHIVTIELAPPIAVPPPVMYRPGQFCFVRFLGGRMGRDEHPYTISSAPSSSLLAITAKDCGDWSGALCSAARVGDPVAVDGAYGAFSYTALPPAQAGTPLIFVAGGIGITPFMSMLDQLAAERSRRPVHVIWKVRRADELFLDRALNAWQGALSLRVDLFASDARPAAKSGGSGFAEPARLTVADICASLSADEVAHGHYFICGPSALIRDGRRYLRQIGVSRSRLHDESFNF